MFERDWEEIRGNTSSNSPSTLNTIPLARSSATYHISFILYHYRTNNCTYIYLQLFVHRSTRFCYFIANHQENFSNYCNTTINRNTCNATACFRRRVALIALIPGYWQQFYSSVIVERFIEIDLDLEECRLEEKMLDNRNFTPYLGVGGWEENKQILADFWASIKLSSSFSVKA